MIISWLRKLRDRNLIVERYIGAKRPNLHPVDNAMAICKRYKISVSFGDLYHLSSIKSIGEEGPCYICRETTKYATFLSVPSYTYPKAVELAEERVRAANAFRKHRGFPEEEPVIGTSIAGMAHLKFVCSENCIASYTLWSLLVPPFEMPSFISKLTTRVRQA